MVAENAEQAWYQKGAGKKLIAAEKVELTGILSRICGYHLIFLGSPGLAGLVKTSLISHRVLIHPQAKGIEGISPLLGKTDELPLRKESVDALVLAHVFEQSANPHEILREAQRVLIPEGQVVITGINPFSLFGVWYYIQRARGKVKSGKMISAGRIKDWLRLMNFQLVSCNAFYFQPSGFTWSIFGGGYTIVAVKRVIPLTPIRKRWRYEQRIWQDGHIPKPTIIKM